MGNSIGTTMTLQPVGTVYRSYAEIQTDLKQEIPAELLATRAQGGVEITYIKWNRVVELADEYAPGWEGDVRVTDLGDAVTVTYGITIPTARGSVRREATGYEKKETSSYGDPTSNAESMAFRRAWAKHGLGLYLYNKSGNEGTTSVAATTRTGWNGVLWYGSARGKQLTDPSVDVKSLQWGADHTDHPEQRDAILAEISRRRGAPVTVPEIPFGPTGDARPSGDRVTTTDIAALKAKSDKGGIEWSEIKAIAFKEFEITNLASLTKDQLILLQLEAGLSID